jgi:uncharacterized protein YggU (UPF0235/DUF167 family)
MDDQEIHLHSGRTGAAITVQVTVGAARTEIKEIMDDGTLIINQTVSRLGKMADEELIEFLARVLDISREKIEIIAGISGRDKLISILDTDTETVQARILQSIQ